MQKQYKIKNKETGQIHHWSVPTILREINRDRSASWSRYNEKDWREGLKEWTEYELVK